MSTLAETAAACDRLLDGCAARYDQPRPGLRLARRELVSLIRQGLIAFRPPEPIAKPGPKPRRIAR